MFEVYGLKAGLSAVRRRIETMKGGYLRPLIIGVAGGSGSGKTTKVAEKIQNDFPGSVILHMDDYFWGREFMESIGSNNFDDPIAVDLYTLKRDLELLKTGLSIDKPIYSFKTGTRQGYEKFDSADLIIVEGLFALCSPLVQEIDFKIFVDVSTHGSLLRRLIRDVGRTGQPEQRILKQYVETVFPMYKHHIEPTRSLADIVIANQYQPKIEAKSCPSQEVQIKAFLDDKGIPSSELEKIGFKKCSSSFQYDIYYFAPNWKPPYCSELMRIRKENGKYFLAYKGPVCKGPLRVRPKIEFEVGLGMRDVLQQLGYGELLSLIKLRKRFVNIDNLEIVVDEFGNEGSFLEFRVKTLEEKDKIPELLRKLGIKEKDITEQSYVEIFLY